MKFAWYTRKLKKHVSLLVTLTCVFVLVHFATLNGYFLAWNRQNNHNRSLGVMDLDVPMMNHNKQMLSSNAVNQNSNPRKRISTGDITSSVNNKEAPLNDPDVTYHVEYLIDGPYDQVKAIHDNGAKAINLKQTHCQKRLPQALIIGNFKSGTQEFLEFMFMHPRIRIFREPFIEAHFFAGRYRLGLQWYKSQMPCTYENQITIEKSGSYLQDPAAPARIQAMNASIKLIALFREPVARAISHFSFSKELAKKYQNNFDRCAIDSKSGAINRNCFVIKHSLYDEGMERYLRLFNRNQIKIIDAVEFNNNPYAILHETETFLNIEHFIERKTFVFIKEKGFHCLRSIRNSSVISCYDKGRGRNDGTKLPNIKVSSATLKKLKEFFKPHNDRFFQQINRTFNWHYDDL